MMDQASDKKKEVLRSAIDKIAMVDAGEKGIDGGMLQPMSREEMKNKVFYPCFHLSGKEAPMLKGVGVGDSLTLVLEVIVKACNSRQGISGEEHHDYDLEIRKIGKVGA